MQDEEGHSLTIIFTHLFLTFNTGTQNQGGLLLSCSHYVSVSCPEFGVSFFFSLFNVSILWFLGAFHYSNVGFIDVLTILVHCCPSCVSPHYFFVSASCCSVFSDTRSEERQLPPHSHSRCSTARPNHRTSTAPPRHNHCNTVIQELHCHPSLNTQ